MQFFSDRSILALSVLLLCLGYLLPLTSYGSPFLALTCFTAVPAVLHALSLSSILRICLLDTALIAGILIGRGDWQDRDWLAVAALLGIAGLGSGASMTFIRLLSRKKGQRM